MSESFNISIEGLRLSTRLSRRGSSSDKPAHSHNRPTSRRACSLNFSGSVALKLHNMEMLLWLTVSTIISAGK